jgi:hypothetical protein
MKQNAFLKEKKEEKNPPKMTPGSTSAISWRQVLVVEEAKVPGENHLPWASNW